MNDIAAWWSNFSDPVLDSLIQRATADNLDIAQAAARLKQARASRDQARARLLPTFSASVDQSRSEGSGIAAKDVYEDAIDASWSVDLFGGLRRNAEASRASLQAAGYDFEDVRISIAAETARAYFETLTYRARLSIARDTLATQDDNRQIAEFRAQAGLVSALDVEQSRAQWAETAASIPVLVTSEAEARYRLSVLIGRPPGAVDDLLVTNDMPCAPGVPDAGVPADLLRRRPDVRAAERRLAAATARIGVAEADLLPTLSLSGALSSSAATWGALNETWSSLLLASLTQPLFQGGRLRAGVRERRAAAEESSALYRATVLAALQDAENGLVAWTSASERVSLLRDQMDAAQSAATLARLNYRAGLTDLQRLLDTERSLLSARDGLASARGDQGKAQVQLYLALGGGWAPSKASR